MTVTKSKIHFIGIGGIGVSALAKYYLLTGHEVSGCDLVSSEITEQLQKMGGHIRIGKPDVSCISAGTEKIIYSPAVQKTNPELLGGVKTLSYPEALGELTKAHYTIAISGTHGKSTTTSMIGLLLVKAGFDPSIIVGTKLKELGDSNCRVGKSKYLVIEADEHFASFLNYWPKIAVLTTVEADHLDYYKNLGNILKAFKKYLTHVSKDGYVVANKDDENIKKIIASPQFQVSHYSIKQKEAARIKKILKIPGAHNVSNALAALTTARILKISDAVSYRALGEYKGSWRRFEVFDAKISASTAGKDISYTLVSDYGHHPTEVKVTVQAAREKWPKAKLWLVFQPHQYYRTYVLFKDFVKVLTNLPVDKLIVTDIYDVAGREDTTVKSKVSSELLVKKIQSASWRTRYSVLYIPTLDEIERYVEENLQGGEVVMVMGAGSIYNLTLRLTQGKPSA